MRSQLDFADNIYHVSGAITEKTSGWQFIPSTNSGGNSYNAAEGYYPDKGGQLLGPPIPCGEFEFYKLSFDVKASENCHWGVSFYDNAGNRIVADVYSSVFGDDKKQHYEQIVYGRENSANMRSFFQSVKGMDVWDLRIIKISPDETSSWCDELYKTLPSLSYIPAHDRLKKLPKTMDAMKTGKAWRIVMLGDSIVNDTFNSNFQALLLRLYPKADLKFICSVRGSTGCWYYREPGQFKAYVTDLKPDLLVIGGISHRNDIYAIREVIETTKRDVGCEIMLLSGPLGKDWRKSDSADLNGEFSVQTWNIDPFAKKQMDLASELDIEYFDISTIWNNYLGASRKPPQWFHRDVLHGNDRGKQILGRILEAYFSR
ncbi:MAG: hypothetical protein A2020_15350 [Lentisphaerae bacterium GWF2_45_14]|nr:MAG: hypothetical protein A2020_15350 [Lentisphaerae bacterium GWF2_45_14]